MIVYINGSLQLNALSAHFLKPTLIKGDVAENM